MNQHPSHSNIPKFSINKSATGILRQEPTPENTVQYKNWFSNFCMSLLLLIIVFSVTLMILHSCTDESDYQSAAFQSIDKKEIKQ